MNNKKYNVIYDTWKGVGILFGGFPFGSPRTSSGFQQEMPLQKQLLHSCLLEGVHIPDRQIIIYRNESRFSIAALSFY